MLFSLLTVLSVNASQTDWGNLTDLSELIKKGQELWRTYTGSDQKTQTDTNERLSQELNKKAGTASESIFEKLKEYFGGSLKQAPAQATSDLKSSVMALKQKLDSQDIESTLESLMAQAPAEYKEKISKVYFQIKALKSDVYKTVADLIERQAK